MAISIKYQIVPAERFMVQRVSETEETRLIEDIALVGSILDARRLVRAVTEYDRRNPEDKATQVLDYGDVEVH